VTLWLNRKDRCRHPAKTVLVPLAYALVGWFALNIAGILSCGRGGGNPIDPSSPPPTPSPTPTPVNRLFPSQLVHADGGTRWEPPLHGAVICCADDDPRQDEGLIRGWPLINEAAAREFAAAGVNATAIRTGPNPPGDPDHRPYEMLRPTVDMLGGLGIMVDVSLIDGWVLKHGLSAWPGEGCEIFSEAPKAHHKQHIRRVVQETLAPWVYYSVGNEVSICPGHSEAWYRGVYDTAKQAGAQIVGGDEEYAFLDFEEIHGWKLPIAKERPMHLSESNNEFHAPADWLELFKNAEQVGGTVYYWAGPATEADRAETLRLLKGWLDAGRPRAVACDMPTTCPPITKWGGHEHTCEGNVCLLDSTPKFGHPPRPSNEEHNSSTSCTGQDEGPLSAAWRRCEDPRGAAWSGVLRVMGNPFQAKAQVGSLVRICPRDDAVDYFGKPVQVGPDPCTQFVVTYR
jgi:hypothetical protein